MAKESNKNQKNKKSKPYIFAVGRRKESVARVRLFDSKTKISDSLKDQFEKGKIIVNGMDIKDYFNFFVFVKKYEEILKTIEGAEKFFISIKAEGGGKSSQMDAIILGIARVFEKYDREKYRPPLKKLGYLTRDPRVRERRKVGTGGKARRKKQSPKR